ILKWTPGQALSLSDLSPDDKQRAFPHIFEFRLTDSPEENFQARLTIHVKGRWNVRLVPPWLGRRWVAAVCREHARLLAVAL
ncbi:MAG: hypothetical protein KDA41_05795, partial [Planctomycetales bacterium]|nr:hypothetical protein [Planctomycetales bacterium]